MGDVSTTPQPKRQRHLIDFDNPPPPSTQRSLTRVQQLIVSTLVGSTIMHLALGLCVLSYAADPEQRSARIGLLVVAAGFGLAAIAAALAIHRRSPLSPWVLLGLLPSIVTAVLIF